MKTIQNFVSHCNVCDEDSAEGEFFDNENTGGGKGAIMLAACIALSLHLVKWRGGTEYSVLE